MCATEPTRRLNGINFPAMNTSLAVAPALSTNRLLDSLDAKDRAGVLAACHEVVLVVGDVIDEPGATIEHVYFPTGSFLSLHARFGEHSLEVALAGSEGLYGIPVSMGVGTSPAHVQVQGGGPAWCLSADSFRRELARVPALQRVVDRYIFVVMSQLMQTAGCHHFHRLEQRLARCLLMTADRTHAATFNVTHEFLAYMLGVRRVGVTEEAGGLQDRGVIRYRRGVVTILDRPGLERAACACYRCDRATYDRVIG